MSVNANRKGERRSIAVDEEIMSKERLSRRYGTTRKRTLLLKRSFEDE